MEPRPSSESSRLSRFIGVVGRVLAGLLALEAVAVFVFRRGWVDGIRRFNKRVLNPVMMKLAGSRHWYASVIHHVGRVSGKQYATPVVIERVGDRFYVPLPYGEEVDWCRNVLASGSCTLVSDGVAHFVGSPELVPAEQADPVLPPRARRVYRLFGVESYLRLSEVSPR